jgi:hypothetical protein
LSYKTELSKTELVVGANGVISCSFVSWILIRREFPDVQDNDQVAVKLMRWDTRKTIGSENAYFWMEPRFTDRVKSTRNRKTSEMILILAFLCRFEQARAFIGPNHYLVFGERCNPPCSKVAAQAFALSRVSHNQSAGLEDILWDSIYPWNQVTLDFALLLEQPESEKKLRSSLASVAPDDGGRSQQAYWKRVKERKNILSN